MTNEQQRLREIREAILSQTPDELDRNILNAQLDMLGSKVRHIPRTELQAGDIWYYHGGWHRVIRVDHDARGNRPEVTRTLAVIEGVNAWEGRNTYGTQEWATGLRTDLAEQDVCTVARS